MMAVDSWVLGSCITCKDSRCFANSIFIKKHPAPTFTTKAFSDEFSKELCSLINKARLTAKLKALDCNPKADTISWHRCEEMKDMDKAVDANKEKRLSEWRATKPSYKGDGIE